MKKYTSQRPQTLRVCVRGYCTMILGMMLGMMMMMMARRRRRRRRRSRSRSKRRMRMITLQPMMLGR